MNKIKTIAATLALLAGGTMLTACGGSSADTVSSNLSTAADHFEINRRIVFYNGITGKYILVVEGLCSLGNYDTNSRLSVTCKVGPGEYKKDFLGLSDNVTFFAEQLDSANASEYHYRVVFRPEEIIPDFDLQTSKDD